VALEVGTHSRWIQQELEALGHQVLVANARKLALIYQGNTKNDRRDARLLARLARADPQLLHPIRHRSNQAQADLAVIRARDCLVRTRTSLVNFVRGMLKSTGLRAPRCGTKTFDRKVLEMLPAEYAPALQPLLAELARLTARIRAYDRTIEELCRERYSETAFLRQPRGVGPLTALAFVLTLEDPHRFPKNRIAGSFLGLRPRQKQSGERDPQLRITKAGNRLLRRLLVGSAQYVLGPFGHDCDLRRFGDRLRARGGKAAHKRAVVAVARKLAVLLLSLWRSQEPYEPLRNHPPEANPRAA
jgi:transposase